MTTDQAAIIAGFGFDTESAAPDLSDLDEVLARIVVSGASHAELSLCGYELIAGGRILPERRRKLERICARHPLAYNHLHVHDSFGRPTSMAGFYSHTERIAFGMGDLHLPMGWGDIDWEAILPQLAFRPGTVMIVELPPHHLAELESCAATARRFAEIVNQAQRQAA